MKKLKPVWLTLFLSIILALTVPVTTVYADDGGPQGGSNSTKSAPPPPPPTGTLTWWDIIRLMVGR